MVSAIIESLACLTAAEFMQHLLPNKALILLLISKVMLYSRLLLSGGLSTSALKQNHLWRPKKSLLDSTFFLRSFYHIALDKVCDRSVGALPHPKGESPHQYLCSCDLLTIPPAQDGLQIHFTRYCGSICLLSSRKWKRRKAKIQGDVIYSVAGML